MRIGDHMHKLTGLESCHLREHMRQHSVLHDVPVIRRKHVLRALIKYGIERVSADIEGH